MVAFIYGKIFKVNNKFEYLEGGKDGMLKRFVGTLQNEYPICIVNYLMLLRKN